MATGRHAPGLINKPLIPGHICTILQVSGSMSMGQWVTFDPVSMLIQTHMYMHTHTHIYIPVELLRYRYRVAACNYIAMQLNLSTFVSAFFLPLTDLLNL